MIGQTISHYRILEKLGLGGMGVVYEAEDLKLHRHVALKFLPEGVATDSTAMRRFEREARAASTLNHPNICTIHEVEEHNRQPVIVMELLEGESLKDKIHKGPLPTAEFLEFGIQSSEALEAAHAKGIIHRDIKPGNIFIVNGKRVKVLDFGLAKVMPSFPEHESDEESLTMQGVIPGTAGYMSPEQVRGEEIDARSDLFSLGVVLYEMATGTRPFLGKNRVLVMDAILNAQPDVPSLVNRALPAAFDTIISKSLEKDRKLRYQRASDICSDLKRLQRETELGNADPRQNLTLEVAHVLFLDVVAYSRLPMEQQAEVLHRLQQLVRETAEFQRARQAGRLISLPTGDGMALVFFHEAEAAVRCSMELSRSFVGHDGIAVRMGIHSGPVYRVADINANRNVAGGGINVAQRVMDCGDGGHILVSKSVADVLSHLAAWNGALHDLGEIEVKHGVRIHVYNLYTGEVGNSSLPSKFQKAQLALAQAKSRRISFGLATVVVVAFAVGGYWRWGGRPALTEKDTIVLADFTNTTGDDVFNDALKEGLAVELDQSPFLNILSEGKVSQQLRYMGQSSEQRLTPELAREVCRREGSKAMLLGSIALIGTHFVIGLKAVSCSNGDSLGKEQVEAQRREDVLREMHAAAGRLRKKLGESLASIQKYDTPLEQATTSSLEALQAYSMAMKIWRARQDVAAIPLFKRAVELDPSFALAYSDLAIMYSDQGEAGVSAEYSRKAYALRDRVTERERFSIDSTYFQSVTGELEKAAQVNEEWRQVYPHALGPRVTLGLLDSDLGKLESALAHDLEAMQVANDTARVYSNLSYDYVSLDRLDDVKKVLEEARAKKLDDSLLPNFYQLAFLENDGKEMARCIAAAFGTDAEDSILSSQADTEAYHGRLSNARELSRRAVAAALRGGAKETAATWQATSAMREAEFGNGAEGKKEAEAALALGPTRDVRIAAAMAFARSGDLAHAQSMVNDLYKEFPVNTLVVNYWLPSIRAAMALARGDAPLAVGFLQTTAAYELAGGMPPFSAGGTMYPVYLRGLAYLAQRKWAEAAAEFEKIRDHRGLVWNFPTGTFTYLELGRAYTGAGEIAKARDSYRAFFSLWQDADPEIGALREAKAGFAKLK